MKKVSELYSRHPGSDIFIVGTGASLRVFPLALLEGRISIGLNDAFRFCPVTYGITVHPDLYIPEFSPIPWITKHDKMKNLVSAAQLGHAEKNFYFFESDGKQNTQSPNEPRDEGRMLEWVKKPTADYLYLWSSISQTGVNLAANMGARNIFLVGCDQTELLGNAHAHAKPTRWKGVDPKHRYRQYFEGLSEVRLALRERSVNLVSLTPFVGLGHLEDDFKKLCGELNMPEFLETPPDRSPAVSLTEKINWFFTKHVK